METEPGSGAPGIPEHSLPSYYEPTPETPQRMTREDEAEAMLGRTAFAPGTRTLSIALFIVTIAVVPASQIVSDLSAGKRPAPFRVLMDLMPQARFHSRKDLRSLWDLPPRGAELKQAEKAIENESVVSQWLRPKVQAALVGTLGAGNEQAYTGRRGWLFYRPDVEYVTGPPFLDPAQLKQRREGGVQPDPVAAIAQFHDQLAARGIELIVMPAPVKPVIDGPMLGGGPQPFPVQNPSFAEFKARLEERQIRLFDPAPLLTERKISQQNAPLYLETDTHWRPETMEWVAQTLAGSLKASRPNSRPPSRLIENRVSAIGDIATMLKLPSGQRLYEPQSVTIHQVAVGNSLWRQSADAETLLLGDSFSNIFSLKEMGWGEGAGFAEHLSYDLGQPLDCILRNSDASFATRELLSRELARGHDRLAGKKRVIWEFASRELSFGNWKWIDMSLGHPKEARFYAPKPGETDTVSGTVQAASTVPRAGTVPYKDHILTIHLVDITGLSGGAEPAQALVYLQSMRDNEWTRAARLRIGDRITVRLEAWSDVSARLDKLNRSEIEDPALQLEEPCWGELAL